MAIESHWGDYWLMLGAFGMLASINPWVDPTFASGTTATFPQTDKYTDTRFDAQYQFQGNNYWLTLRGSYINDSQRLDASFLNRLSAN